MTEQIGDFISYNNQTGQIWAWHFPLERYIEDNNLHDIISDYYYTLPPPEDPIIVKSNDEEFIFTHPDGWTNCFRWHIAVWSIENNHLFINHILYPDFNNDIPLKLLFPDSNDTGIKAEWYTGQFYIFIPTNHEIVAHRLQYHEIRALLVTVEKGNVTSVAEIDRSQCRGKNIEKNYRNRSTQTTQVIK